MSFKDLYEKAQTNAKAAYERMKAIEVATLIKITIAASAILAAAFIPGLAFIPTIINSALPSSLGTFASAITFGMIGLGSFVATSLVEYTAKSSMSLFNTLFAKKEQAATNTEEVINIETVGKKAEVDTNHTNSTTIINNTFASNNNNNANVVSATEQIINQTNVPVTKINPIEENATEVTSIENPTTSLSLN